MERAAGSVLRGAAILSLAGITCKLLGAAYRIPLVRLIGDEGIGLYQMAYPIYLVILSLSTAGMPLAISRLVAERAALGDVPGIRRAFRLALATLGILGLLGGGVMAAGARFFALRVAADPRAYPVFVSLAPAIPLMALMAAFRGFFQGGQDMWPSALSQISEQVVRVATLLVLANTLLPLGVAWAAAGAAFGAAAGGAAGLILLLWWYLHRPPRMETSLGAARPASLGYLAARLFWLAMPIAVGALFLPLMQAIDSVMVPSLLQAIGYDTGQATAALGRLGNAWAVIYVPVTFTAALATSLVPAVTETWTRRETGATSRRIYASLRMAILICLPATCGMWTLAGEICRVLYGTASAADALAILAPAALFLGVQGVCAGALQGVGRAAAPVKNAALGFVLKVAVTGLLCGHPALGARGAGLGTVAGAALATSLSLFDLRRQVRVPGNLYADFARSGMATAAMVALLRWLGSAAVLMRLDAYQRLALLLPTGFVVYGAALWLTGGVGAGDLQALRRFLPRSPGVAPHL